MAPARPALSPVASVRGVPLGEFEGAGIKVLVGLDQKLVAAGFGSLPAKADDHCGLCATLPLTVRQLTDYGGLGQSFPREISLLSSTRYTASTASPMPALAPVTTAVRPARLKSMSFL
jgi:hypothetical protein